MFIARVFFLISSGNKNVTCVLSVAYLFMFIKTSYIVYCIWYIWALVS